MVVSPRTVVRVPAVGGFCEAGNPEGKSLARAVRTERFNRVTDSGGWVSATVVHCTVLCDHWLGCGIGDVSGHPRDCVSKPDVQTHRLYIWEQRAQSSRVCL